MALVYGPLSTAEQAYTEEATTSQALSDANEELISLLENLQRADDYNKLWIPNNRCQYHY